ncbi:MAG: NUDIX domain-containing protein [Erysipelotrichaceae bacterium]|jgi:8-oxo-dGTP pyrophosphatase MutT (NUDIX family)|nr:NUDIX domain-containing protein [Erysipelotrichaceae bacterium]
MEKEKSCGAVIARRKHERIEVLVIQQIQGHWCFPKGHVEGKETEQETALREVHEETGLRIALEDGFRTETNYSPKPGVLKEVVYFLGHPEAGREKIQKDELLDEKWVSISEAYAAITYENDQHILRDAVRFMRERDPEIGALL